MQAATKAEKKSTKEADEKFARAVDGLSDYEKQCHSKETVSKKMAEAKAKDRSSLTSLNALKEKMRMKVRVAHITLRRTHSHRHSVDRRWMGRTTDYDR
jgi:hypothetical protein